MNINSAKLLYPVVVWMSFYLSPFISQAQDIATPIYHPNLFASVKTLPDSDKVEAARKLYKGNCRKMSEQDALKSLGDLTAIAHDLNNLSLECAVFDMKSDYYSVNRGYNNLSTSYFDKAIALADKNGLTLEKGIYQHRKAVYYFGYKRNTEACRYFLLSEANFREVGFEKVPFVSKLFTEAANFYYSLNDFEDARYNLSLALKYLKPGTGNRINIINTIGLTYRNDGHYTTAMRYFNDALKLATTQKDSVWIAITSGNIGSIYFNLQQYDKAVPLIETDYRQSLKYRQMQNSVIALLRLVKISIDRNQLKKAELQLDTTDAILLKTPEDVLGQRVKYYELRALLNDKLGNNKQALIYRHQFETARDSVARRDNITAIERVKLQWEMDRSREEIKRIKTIAENDALKLDAIILVLILLIVISALIYNQKRIKAVKEKELLASEKLRVDEELKNATLALHGYTENLMRKNILIDDFKAEIEKLQVKFNDKDGADQLNKMMQAHIMTEENWTDFKKLFNRVHSAFFYNLRNKYPHLSDTDTRLLALIKLRLNNREMAGMMGVTIDGIKKSKQRLRKKMDIALDTEIEDIVNSI
ncbi:hypothetical protein FFF34_018900 [Inquilinus sp. KBS0705]|nr:hypothetical protein FFF34_018900 [Inquilinus sp. KBS0705]